MDELALTIVTREGIQFEFNRDLAWRCACLRDQVARGIGETSILMPHLAANDVGQIWQWLQGSVAEPMVYMRHPLVDNRLELSGVPGWMVSWVSNLFDAWGDVASKQPLPAWYVAFDFHVGPLPGSPNPLDEAEARLFVRRQCQEACMHRFLHAVRALGIRMLEELVCAKNALINLEMSGLDPDVLARRYGESPEAATYLLDTSVVAPESHVCEETVSGYELECAMCLHNFMACSA